MTTSYNVHLLVSKIQEKIIRNAITFNTENLLNEGSGTANTLLINAHQSMPTVYTILTRRSTQFLNKLITHHLIPSIRGARTISFIQPDTNLIIWQQFQYLILNDVLPFKFKLLTNILQVFQSL